MEAFDPLHGSLRLPLHKGSMSWTNSLYLNESLTSIMLEKKENNIVLTKPLVSQMLHRIRYSVRTRHKVNFRFAYRLPNIETNEYTV